MICFYLFAGHGPCSPSNTPSSLGSSLAISADDGEALGLPFARVSRRMYLPCIVYMRAGASRNVGSYHISLCGLHLRLLFSGVSLHTSQEELNHRMSASASSSSSPRSEAHPPCLEKSDPFRNRKLSYNSSCVYFDATESR